MNQIGTTQFGVLNSEYFQASLVYMYSQVPNKRVYSISIFRFSSPYLVYQFSTLCVYWALFSTLLIYLAILFYEIYLKYPPYSYIWPYLFNWHLRVASVPQLETLSLHTKPLICEVCTPGGRVYRGLVVSKNVHSCSIIMYWYKKKALESYVDS